MKNKENKNTTLSFHFFFCLVTETRMVLRWRLKYVATGRHLACSSAAVIGTQIHNAVLLARVSPWLLISSRLQQQLTMLLAVVCLCCSTETKATDRSLVCTSYSPSTSSVICHAACFLVSPSRCNSSVTVVTSVQVARAGYRGWTCSSWYSVFHRVRTGSGADRAPCSVSR